MFPCCDPELHSAVPQGVPAKSPTGSPYKESHWEVIVATAAAAATAVDLLSDVIY